MREKNGGTGKVGSVWGGEGLAVVGGALGWSPGFLQPGTCGRTLEQRVSIATFERGVLAVATADLETTDPIAGRDGWLYYSRLK